MNRQNIDTCFVIMPYGTKQVNGRPVNFDSIYRLVFMPAINSVRLPNDRRLSARRADETEYSTMLKDELMRYLDNARIALVDVSSNNANVFYEMGIRHALRESCTVLVRQADAEPTPFDIDHTKAFPYRFESPAEIREAQQSIALALEQSLQMNRVDSPVHSALRGELRRRNALPYDLPDEAKLDEFVGRERELVDMLERLACHDFVQNDQDHVHKQKRNFASRAKVVVLTGPSGIGKSLLAQKFAREARQCFDASLFLDAVGSQDPNQLAGQIAARFGTKEEELAGTPRLRDRLALCAGHRTLLTLDDAQDPAALKPLLDALPAEFAVIVTTQHRKPQDERRGHLDLTPLALDESLALLSKSRGLDAVDAGSDARRLCEIVDHFPQSLVLVGRYCTSQRLDLGDFITSFCANDDRKQLFRYGLRPSQGRASLTHVIDTLLEQLELDEPGIRKFYRCLSACDFSGFSIETAAVTSQTELHAARDILSRLEQRALLDRTRSGELRYSLHSLFAAYILGQAREHDDENPARSRHCRYWMQALRAANFTVGLGLPEPLRSNRGDVALAAAHCAAQGNLDQDLVERLNDFLSCVGDIQSARGTMAAIVRWAEDTQDAGVEAIARIRYAKVCARKNPREAWDMLVTLPSLIERVPDSALRQRIEVKRLVRLGAIQKHAKALPSAIHTLEQAVALACAEPADRKQLKRALNTLALAYSAHGESERALHTARAAFDAQSDEDDTRAGFFERRLLASCLIDCRELASAQQVFNDCWRFTRSDSERIFLVSGLLDTAQRLRDTERFADALSIVELQIKLAAQLSGGSLHVRGLIVLGDIHAKRNDVPAALHAYASVVQRAADLQDTRPVTGALRKMATDLGMEGRNVDRQHALELALSVAEAGGDAEIEAAIHNRLGGIYKAEHRRLEARREYQRQIALGQRHRLPVQEVYGRRGLAALHRTESAFADELEQYELALQALDRVAGINAVHGRLQILQPRAIACMRTEKYELAIASLVAYLDLLPHAKKQQHYETTPVHNVFVMLHKQVGSMRTVALLREVFERTPDARTATALAQLAHSSALELLKRNSAAETWLPHALFALHMLIVGDCPGPLRGPCIALLTAVADAAEREPRDVFETQLVDQPHSPPFARELLSGFLTSKKLFARALANEPITEEELRSTGKWALECKIAIVRGWTSKRIASVYATRDRWDDAEKFYRAAIDAYMRAGDTEGQAKTLQQQQRLLSRMPGREHDAIECLRQLVGGPIEHLEKNAKAWKRACLELGHHFVTQRDVDGVSKAAGVLLELARKHSREGEALAWKQRGNWLRRLDVFAEALDAYRQQLLLSIEGQTREGVDCAFTAIDQTFRIAKARPLQAKFWQQVLNDLESNPNTLARDIETEVRERIEKA